MIKDFFISLIDKVKSNKVYKLLLAIPWMSVFTYLWTSGILVKIQTVVLEFLAKRKK